MRSLLAFGRRASALKNVKRKRLTGVLGVRADSQLLSHVPDTHTEGKIRRKGRVILTEPDSFA